VKQRQGEKEVKELEQRKADIKARINALREELRPHEKAVENLHERLRDLEDDWKEILDQIQEEEKKARKVK
jgi:predicted  nucleic acid-binding Zn-ribbon protein